MEVWWYYVPQETCHVCHIIIYESVMILCTKKLSCTIMYGSVWVYVSKESCHVQLCMKL